jgi:hypothetical protein
MMREIRHDLFGGGCAWIFGVIVTRLLNAQDASRISDLNRSVVRAPCYTCPIPGIA